MKAHSIASGLWCSWFSIVDFRGGLFVCSLLRRRISITSLSLSAASGFVYVCVCDDYDDRDSTDRSC